MEFVPDISFIVNDLKSSSPEKRQSARETAKRFGFAVDAQANLRARAEQVRRDAAAPIFVDAFDHEEHFAKARAANHRTQPGQVFLPSGARLPEFGEVSMQPDSLDVLLAKIAPPVADGELPPGFRPGFIPVTADGKEFRKDHHGSFPGDRALAGIKLSVLIDKNADKAATEEARIFARNLAAFQREFEEAAA